MPLSVFLVVAALIGAVILFLYTAVKAALIIAILSVLGLVVFYGCLTQAARHRLGAAPLIAATLVPLAAWLLPNLWLLYAFMAILVPCLARGGGQVAAMYLFALMLLPGLDQVVKIGSLELFQFGVHDALACGATLSLLTHRAWRTRRWPLDLPVMALILMLVAALSRNTSATNFLRVFVTIALDCALPYYIVSRGVKDHADLQRCLLHLAAAGAVVSLILLYEARGAWPIYNALVDLYGLPDHPSVKSRGTLLRAGGPFLESTSAAMILVFCFLASWMARPAFRDGRYQAAFLVLLLVGLLPPQSRGAWVGLLTGMVMIDLYMGRLRFTMLRLAVASAGAAVLFAAAQFNAQLAVMLGLSGDSVETVDYRGQLLARGMQEFWQSPLIGFAYPEMLRRLDDMRQGEGIVDFVNAHLFIALLTGGIGLAIFNGTILFYLGHVWRARRHLIGGRDIYLRTAAFSFAALATPVQMLFFTSLGGRVQVFLFVFFAFAVAAGRRVAQPDQPATPSNWPEIAFASSPMTAPVAPAANSAASSGTFSKPIRESMNQP